MYIHTHTHTHTYIYIYILKCKQNSVQNSVPELALFFKKASFEVNASGLRLCFNIF